MAKAFTGRDGEDVYEGGSSALSNKVFDKEGTIALFEKTLMNDPDAYTHKGCMKNGPVYSVTQKEMLEFAEAMFNQGKT